MINKDAERILELLERQFFDPVLRAKPDSLPPHQRDQAADVHAKVAALRERVRASDSMNDVVLTFSGYAREHALSLDPELEAIGLPTLGDLRYEVEKLAAELGLHLPAAAPADGRRGNRQEA